MSKFYVTVKLTVIEPDERHASEDELRNAIEQECANLIEVDVVGEDEYEEWTVDEATVLSIEPADES